MFHPSSQHISLRQQVIALSQNYPCPRCSSGILEPFGLTETLQCSHCARGFVPRNYGRSLYPSRQLGWKIASIFWWDGFRWHWGGTTATSKQLSTIIMLSILPAIGILAYASVVPQTFPRWGEPTLLGVIAAFLTLQLMYLVCWDFDFFRRVPAKPQDESVKDAR